jgi:hypothetical protein
VTVKAGRGANALAAETPEVAEPQVPEKRVLTAPGGGLPGKTVAFPLASLGFVGFIAKNLIWRR